MFLRDKHELFANMRVSKIDIETHTVIETAEYNDKGLCVKLRPYDENIPQIYIYDDNDNLIFVSYSGAKEYYIYDWHNNLIEELQLDFIKGRLFGTDHTYYSYNNNNLLVSKKSEDYKEDYIYNTDGIIETKIVYSDTDTKVYRYLYTDDGHDCSITMDDCDWYHEHIVYDKNNNIIYHLRRYGEDEDDIQEDIYEYNEQNMIVYHKRTNEFIETTQYDDKNRIISEYTVYMDQDIIRYYAQYDEEGYLIKDGYIDGKTYIYAYEDLPQD